MAKHKTLGQVFTPNWIIAEILDLVGYNNESISVPPSHIPENAREKESTRMKVSKYESLKKGQSFLQSKKFKLG